MTETADGRDANRQDVERQDVERQDVERQDVERQDVERQDVERQDVERQDVERQDVERQDVDKQGVERVFLGWQRPALENVAAYLWQRYATDGVWELSNVAVVLPGARAGRRLNELLARRADEEEVVFFPPLVTTVGQLPELLYECRRPFASRLTQQLAWAAALRETDASVLRQFVQRLPTGADDPAWWELGTLLWRQHRELAADGLDFPHVAAAGLHVPGFTEQARWQALARVQQSYLRQLDQRGLWDRQTARLFAIEHQECHTARDLILVGTVDINRSQRQMLDQVRSRVTAIVYADPDWHQAFDLYGCLDPTVWRTLTIPLSDDQLRTAENPADQASEVVRCLAELDGQFAASEIVVGVPDERLVPLVERQLNQAGVTARYGPGKNVESTRPLRLLRGLLKYLETDRLAELVDLLRHPDMRSWLRTQSPQADSDVSLLDDYVGQRLVTTVNRADWEDDAESLAARRLVDQVSQLLRPLQGSPRLAADWTAPVLELMTRIYGERELRPEVPAEGVLLGASEQLRDALLELQRLPRELASPVTASQAVLMALSTLGQAQIPAPAQDDAVELLGWLELPLDDAPVLVVTQVNEGTIPTSANSDLFLPDRLRAQLGLDDNARRYARDAYALTVLIRSRRELRLIVGRRDELGNPLLPSRLLFATDDANRAARCLRLFGDAADGESPDHPAEMDAAPPTADRHQFVVPHPVEVPQIDTLNVTDFRLFLSCPYRFYLSRVLKLKSIQAEPVELDGAAFGILLHVVLERFGTAAIKDADDADAIQEFLSDTLDDVFRQSFGDTPRPSLRIQRAQMRQRLATFAQHQATWRQSGWQIVMTEGQRETVTTQWVVDDQPFGLRGRIDRIDRHEGSGEFAILDYKSSEEGRNPRAAHNVGGGRGAVKAEQWRDLQLPLYRYLAEELQLSGTTRLGFVTLPRAVEEAGFKLANWTSQELAAADEAARRVVRAVRRQEFWEPKAEDRSLDAGLDRIGQEGIFDRQLERADQPGVAS